MMVWMAYAVAATAASALFVLAGLRVRGPSEPPRAARPRAAIEPNSPSTALAASQGDVAAAIRVALDRVAPMVVRHFVRVDFAVPPGLVARLRGAALVDVIQDLLTETIPGAATGRLLLTALAQGDHVEVAVTDDVPNADQAYRTGQMRGLQERIALLGGTLRVTVHAAEGTTITIRLLGASDHVATAQPDTVPAQVPVPGLPPDATIGAES